MKSGVIFVVILLFIIQLNAQNYSPNSIKTGVGIGVNEGKKESGFGSVVNIGYQRSSWNNRFRLNPNITTGGFLPLLMTDVRDQYYRTTSLGFYGYLDIIKIKSFSIYVGTGGLINYSRGLLGTGGWPDENNNESEYFIELYYGGHLSGGIRVDKPDKRLAYEISPLNICFGNNYFMMAYFKIAIDVKLNE